MGFSKNKRLIILIKEQNTNLSTPSSDTDYALPWSIRNKYLLFISFSAENIFVREILGTEIIPCL